MKEAYLGDGLYAVWDGWMIALYTNEGARVYLEPAVFDSLLRFAESVYKMKIEMKPPGTASYSDDLHDGVPV